MSKYLPNIPYRTLHRYFLQLDLPQPVDPDLTKVESTPCHLTLYQKQLLGTLILKLPLHLAFVIWPDLTLLFHAHLTFNGGR